MNNRVITDAVTAEKKQETGEKRKGNQYQPGQSGNPSGRPKMTAEEKKIRDMFRKLGPKAIKKLEEMLAADRLSSIAKVRIIEIILERAYGKVDTNVKVTETKISMEDAEKKIEEAFAQIRKEKDIR